MVNKNELAGMKTGTRKSLHKSMQMPEGTKNVHKKNKCLAQRSMLSSPPIPQMFFNIRSHPRVNIYRDFRFQPMHSFSLGISAVLKECM